MLDQLTGTGVAPFAIIMLTGRGSEEVAVQRRCRRRRRLSGQGQLHPERLRRTVADAVAKLAGAARPSSRQRAGREAPTGRPTTRATSGSS
ncbi:MAG: hypothetical protein U0790_19325 [Isosphaeraceae bacterium]